MRCVSGTHSAGPAATCLVQARLAGHGMPGPMTPSMQKPSAKPRWPLSKNSMCRFTVSTMSMSWLTQPMPHHSATALPRPSIISKRCNQRMVASCYGALPIFSAIRAIWQELRPTRTPKSLHGPRCRFVTQSRRPTGSVERTMSYGVAEKAMIQSLIPILALSSRILAASCRSSLSISIRLDSKGRF